MNGLEIMRLLVKQIGMAPGDAVPPSNGNLPAAQQATLPGASAGLARQPVGQPGCGTFSVDGSPVLTGPVRQCQQDVPTGCSGGVALDRAALTDTVTSVEITIKPSQMLYMTKLTIFERRSAGVDPASQVMVEVEYDGTTVFPRNTPKAFEAFAFSTEAQRAGLNPLPGGMPLFTRDRPMTIRYTLAGPPIPASNSISLNGVATLAAPSSNQLLANILG